MAGSQLRPQSGPPATTVWWADRRPLAELDLSSLTAEEQARIDRLGLDGPKERSALARVLVRVALSDELGDDPASLRLTWEDGPKLAEPGLRGPWISLSHSVDRVVVAISTAGPVGVDIESAARAATLRPGSLRRVWTPEERDWLDGLHPHDRAAAQLQLWTYKEAVLKASALGITVPLDSVGIEAAGLVPELVRFDDRPELVGGSLLAPLAADAQYTGALVVLSAVAAPFSERSAAALLGD